MSKVKSNSNLKKQTEVITIQYLFGVYILLKALSFHQSQDTKPKESNLKSIQRAFWASWALANSLMVNIIGLINSPFLLITNIFRHLHLLINRVTTILSKIFEDKFQVIDTLWSCMWKCSSDRDNRHALQPSLYKQENNVWSYNSYKSAHGFQWSTQRV